MCTGNGSETRRGNSEPREASQTSGAGCLLGECDTEAPRGRTASSDPESQFSTRAKGWKQVILKTSFLFHAVENAPRHWCRATGVAALTRGSHIHTAQIMMHSFLNGQHSLYRSWFEKKYEALNLSAVKANGEEDPLFMTDDVRTCWGP